MVSLALGKTGGERRERQRWKRQRCDKRCVPPLRLAGRARHIMWGLPGPIPGSRPAEDGHDSAVRSLAPDAIMEAPVRSGHLAGSSRRLSCFLTGARSTGIRAPRRATSRSSAGCTQRSRSRSRFLRTRGSLGRIRSRRSALHRRPSRACRTLLVHSCRPSYLPALPWPDSPSPAPRHTWQAQTRCRTGQVMIWPPQQPYHGAFHNVAA